MPKILLCFDSFKNCMSAAEACRAAARGIAQLGLRDAGTELIPLSDGGEGLVDVLGAYPDFKDSRIFTADVHDCYGSPSKCGILENGDLAVIESARVCGLEAAQKQGLRFMDGTSYGVGEAVAACLSRGFPRIIISLGGSATNDGGAGMAQALGVVFKDARGSAIKPPIRVRDLKSIASADFSGLDPRIRKCSIEIPCDVVNPLLGAAGATMVFGPQKGGTHEMLMQAEEGMAAYAQAMEKATGMKEARDLPGAGAAGGLGAGCLYVLGAKLRSGIDTVLELASFDVMLAQASLVLTGEGRSDAQSALGKVPSGVIRHCRAHGVRCVVISGALGDGAPDLIREGAAGIFSICDRPMALETSIRNARDLLAIQCANVVRLISLCGGLDVRTAL
ncbi:MAG: glycerate kinase [Succinivibrio sp.]